ncbi:MAG TPA: 4Fe-4S binding protein [Gammaproteobacteria bacterium]|nr:4Fe-4S binding protein [Gammaproteobacteria bacterium]
MTMMHPGLSSGWILIAWVCIFVLAAWALFTPYQPRAAAVIQKNRFRTGSRLAELFISSWPLRVLKLLMVALYVLIIYSGLYGTPIPSHNIATTMTWNLWWSGLIVSVFFLGSVWCTVCPWNTLATWLAKISFRGKLGSVSDLKLRVPKHVRNIWPALLLFIGLTWLELGAGITSNPYATALLAMTMLMLATLSIVFFERKAFCRYFCPVGRTIGFYAQLAPVELRHIDAEVCQRCTSLDCYYGNEKAEPCPTGLAMRNLRENTYCTSCGNCIRSCPHHNIDWRLRSVSREAIQDARPRPDEAWFMLGLLALTGLHGLTMMPVWEYWIRKFARLIGDSGQLLLSFTVGQLLVLMVLALCYQLLVALTRLVNRQRLSFSSLFTGMAFISLPLAFSYHLAHNLNHLLRERSGLSLLLNNPLSTADKSLDSTSSQAGMMTGLISQDVLFAMQTALIVFGFWIAILVVRHRGEALLPGSGWRLFPMCLFALLVTGVQLWLLSQPMIMRF